MYIGLVRRRFFGHTSFQARMVFPTRRLFLSSAVFCRFSRAVKAIISSWSLFRPLDSSTASCPPWSPTSTTLSWHACTFGGPLHTSGGAPHSFGVGGPSRVSAGKHTSNVVVAGQTAKARNHFFLNLCPRETIVFPTQQAFLAAPLFVVCEVLFEFGYKKTMQQRIRINAAASIAQFRMAKLAKATVKKD